MAENAAGWGANLDEILGLESVDPADADAKREQWVTSIEAIREDLTDLALRRMTWRALGAMWDSHVPPLPASFVFSYFASTYGQTQLVGIRRQTDTSRNVVSLVRLLMEVTRDSRLLSLRFIVGRFAWGTQHIARRAMEEWDPKRRGYVDETIANADIERLTVAAEKAKDWVDEHIAHQSVSPTSQPVTFDELDEALDTLFEVFKKWYLILTARDLDPIEPIPQYDWVAPFRVPWITGTET